MRIASVGEEKDIVNFTAKTCVRPLAWDPDQRYYVENAPDALASPGEWHLDKSPACNAASFCAVDHRIRERGNYATGIRD